MIWSCEAFQDSCLQHNILLQGKFSATAFLKNNICSKSFIFSDVLSIAQVFE